MHVVIVTGVDSSGWELQRELSYLFSHMGRDPPDSPSKIQQEIEYLRLELDGERELLQLHLSFLVQQNHNQAESAKEQLDL